jgi:putative membrane-bound dehydrogenase-like protein
MKYNRTAAIHFNLCTLGFLILPLLMPAVAVDGADHKREDAADKKPEQKHSVRILFLGDNGHHQPRARANQLIPVMAERGVKITYSDNTDHLNSAMLNQYDGLIVYANIGKISSAQEKALIDYVENGGGFIPLHCASFCFLNSPKYIALVGAQFKRHGGGVFRVQRTQPNHPIVKGLKDFESWDETYVHAKHNDKNRIVLQTRKEGSGNEPWTWIRTQGKGRVFYTAWGHDQRTWSNEGFHDLVERGIRWSVEPRIKARLSTDAKPFKYIKTKYPAPNYPPSGKWGKQNKPFDTIQAPIAGSQSQKHIVTPPGFKAELFASDPQIGPALAMDWDERGRLWLCESVDYPNNMQPPGKGNDRIRICEDTNGDGKADKFTIFADGLSVPTAITFYRGGVIVQIGTETVYLKDTDRDDKADVKKVLMQGWNQGDTHGGVSNFRYGHDNWFWAMQGYNHSRPKYGDKEGQGFRAGFFRFKLDNSDPPNVTDVEFIRSTNNNTWGLGLSEDGLVFGSTANRNPSVYMPIANRYYERVAGWAPATLGGIANNHLFYPISNNVRQVDQHHGYTAASGHALYTARVYPREYWNRTAFVTGPTGKLAGTFVLQKKGADFVSSNDWNIVASDDEWFAPIGAEVGPDGCVWILDWYNYVIQHNPTPVGFKRGKGNAYESKLRDKVHGRVYRVVLDKKASKTVSTPNLQGATNLALVAALKHTNMFWRMHAQRMLVERGDKSIVPQLIELIKNNSVDPVGLNVGVIHALRTLQGLGAIEGKQSRASNGSVDVQAVVAAALRHPSAGVRRNAVQVLPRHAVSVDLILTTGLLADADAQVRLAALLALSDMPADQRAGAAVFDMLKRPENANDRWLADAATSAAATHDAGFLQTVLSTTKRKVSLKPHSANGKPVLKQKPKSKPINLIKNGSFETIHNNKPQHWTTATYSGKALFSIDDGGRNGGKCVKISSASGADASWTYKVPVKRNTRYRLSSYIKTTQFKKNSGYGAQMNLHELQKYGKSSALIKSQGWTKNSTEFNSKNSTSLSVNMLMGGWGQSKGNAFWDDVELIELGPGSGTVQSGAIVGRVGDIVSIVTRNYASKTPTESVVAVLSALKHADEKLATFILEGLASGWPNNKSPNFSDADQAELAAVMAALEQGQKEKLVVLADKWGRRDIFSGDVTAVISALQPKLGDSGLSDEARVDAARRLIRLADNQSSVNAIVKQISSRSSQALTSGLIGALANSREKTTGDTVLAKWSELTPASRRDTVALLLRRTLWTSSLLDQVESKKVARVDLSASDWQLLKLSKDASIAARASKLSNVAGNADRQKILAKMLPYLSAKPNIKVGATLFANTCAKCHAFKGKGGKIGPELTGIGARAKNDILAEIVDPNRSLEANFRLWTIETADFETLTGRLDGESKTSVELLDLNGKRHTILRKDIDSIRASSLSIMPPGLIDHLKPEEVASLIAFLTQMGH